MVLKTEQDWPSQLSDYHNYLTIWLSHLSDYHNYLTIWQSQQSDASCQIYRLTKEQQFDSTLSKHLTDTWYFGCMVFCHILKCWFQPFDAIGRIIWRSQLQKKCFQCHSIAIYSYMICFIKCQWNNLSWNNKHKKKKIRQLNIFRLKVVDCPTQLICTRIFIC